MSKYIFAILALLINSLTIVATDKMPRAYYKTLRLELDESAHADDKKNEVIKLNKCLSKSLVLQALFARAVTSGKMVKDVDGTVTSIRIADASRLIEEEAGYIAILNGRRLYLDLRTDFLNAQLYNEIYGAGVAQEVIAGLEAKIK